MGNRTNLLRDSLSSGSSSDSSTSTRGSGVKVSAAKAAAAFLLGVSGMGEEEVSEVI
jgi:hypothetical protein